MKDSKSPSTKLTRAELDLLIQKAREVALKSPQKAAILLTDWLNRRPRKLENQREKSVTPHSIKKKAA